jgi:hypothetical protein
VLKNVRCAWTETAIRTCRKANTRWHISARRRDPRYSRRALALFRQATRTLRLYYPLNSPAALAWLYCSLAGAAAEQTSAPLPKFVIHSGSSYANFGSKGALAGL